jgi:hypothetical protein
VPELYDVAVVGAGEPLLRFPMAPVGTSGFADGNMMNQPVLESIRACYLVGCDGADSFVRRRMATGVTDLGFSHDWLIVDLVLADQAGLDSSSCSRSCVPA